MMSKKNLVKVFFNNFFVHFGFLPNFATRSTMCAYIAMHGLPIRMRL